MLARYAGVLRIAGIAGVVALALWAGTSFSLPSRIPDDFRAMEPTLKPAQYYLLDKRPRARGRWKSGAIVRFRAPPGVDGPRGKGTFLAARVVAAEGQSVAIAGGELRVEGERVRWDGFSLDPSETLPELRVPKGHVLLLADNAVVARQKPLDGRSFGMVPVHAVEGAIVSFGP